MSSEREPHVPFRPVPYEEGGNLPMPSSVPDGLRLQLIRAPIVAGQEEQFDEWMTVLHQRYDEMLPTLVPERAAFEAIFRHREADGSTWIYHLSLVGEHGSGLTEDAPIDQVHASYSRTVKEPGWEPLEPQLMLTPTHLSKLMQQWGQTGSA